MRITRSLSAITAVAAVFAVAACGGTGGGADPMAFPFDWHRDLILDFADAVEAGRAPSVTGREALKVHDLIDALVTSSREGRAVTIRSGA